MRDGFEPVKECSFGFDYIRCSKTQEAVMNLRKIADSAIAYYISDHATRSGMAIPNQFPGVGMDYGPAPGVNQCCGQEGDKCRPTRHAFDHPVWQALNFSVDDPHRYWYMFEPHGLGNESAFTARAMGNLDCDSTFSTFEIIGRVTPSGEVHIGQMRAKNALE